MKNISSVLFIDADTGTRSQMANAFLRKYGGKEFDSFCSGVQTGITNNYAIEVMSEYEIYLRSIKTNPLSDFIESKRSFHYLIIMCSAKEMEPCPLLPQAGIRLYWNFPNPRLLEGTDEELTEQYRSLRNAIKHQVKKFVKSVNRNPALIDGGFNLSPSQFGNIIYDKIFSLGTGKLGGAHY